jgi:DHA1 family bicyclomycin/chloramphenicol resistance-like MFS transporter
MRDVPTLLLGALAFLAPFAIDASLPGLPAIARALDASHATMQWTLSAYVLATGAGQLVWGPLSDRFGRRPVVIGGLATFVLAGFACATAHDGASLVALRFIQGLGSCAGAVCAFAIVQDLALPPAVRASRQGAISAVNNIGPLAAPLAGVWILGALGWRPLYAIPALVGALVLAVVIVALPETAVTTTDAAVARYRRVLALPRTAGLAVMIFALFAGYFAMIAGSPFVLAAQLHLTTAAFGIAFATEAASALLGSFASSRLAFAAPPERLLALALAIALVAGAANAVAGWFAPSALAFVATMSLYAFGFGIAAPSAYALALRDAGPDAGVASGVLGAALSFGGAAGSALGGSLPWAAAASTGSVVAVGACVAAVAASRARPANGRA